MHVGSRATAENLWQGLGDLAYALNQDGLPCRPRRWVVEQATDHPLVLRQLAWPELEFEDGFCLGVQAPCWGGMEEILESTAPRPTRPLSDLSVQVRPAPGITPATRAATVARVRQVRLEHQMPPKHACRPAPAPVKAAHRAL